MLIQDVFERDVTRAIPPVVYFHQDDGESLRREVEEYIVTGGYPKDDNRYIEDGIHEQFVRLLRGIRSELETRATGLPACWVSGFYGSGKSSFAKLLGLSLDHRKLADGRALAEVLLAQDRSPDAHALKKEWALLTGTMKQSLAVVFDVGSKARDDEQIHAVILRELQKRLDYSKASALVAEHELRLEKEKLFDGFLDEVRKVHGKTWTELKDKPLAEDYFSAALHSLQPALYTDPMKWVEARTGSRFEGKASADEAVVAIDEMMELRAPGRTLFIVVDEVSQYVHDDNDRMLGLQSFVSALGQRLKGKAWLVATGQQKLEEVSSAGSAIVKMKDRFPPALRVHLGVTNIRDVVHKRLLRKTKEVESDLRTLFQLHRAELSLYAYRGDEISETDFVEIYPMLPGHVQLLLDITTGLRSSVRGQGDTHGVRGLLQLLGDLFREKDFARYELGYLVTLDLVYDILHSALPPDLQLTIGKALELAQRRESKVMARAVKAVAMLALAQSDKKKTSAELVARCLYEKLGDKNLEPDVQKALDELRGEGLVSYSEQTGYKIESTAGQEWQRERDDYAPSTAAQSAAVQEAIATMVGDVEKVQLDNLALPWVVLFSDDAGASDVRVRDVGKQQTVITVDLQMTKGESADGWIVQSDLTKYRDRIVWVAGSVAPVRHAATRLLQSARMIERYGARQGLDRDQQGLLGDERNRYDSALRELAGCIRDAFMAGSFYFRGRPTVPRDAGSTFGAALAAFGKRVVSDLYPNPVTYSVTEKDLVYLFDNLELSAPPPVFGQDRLGLLTLDVGRYEVTCNGRVPSDVLAFVRANARTGAEVLGNFVGPPHGVPPDVQRAAVIGLLRGGKVRIDVPGVGMLTSVRDEGARELLKDGPFRKATISENTKEVLTARDRNAICTLFEKQLGKEVARDNDAIADAVAERFATVRTRLTDVSQRFRRLPKEITYPPALDKLADALEACRRTRKVEPTVTAVKNALADLRDGLTLLRRMETDLSDQAIDRLRDADAVLTHTWPGLAAVGATDAARDSAQKIEAHLRADRAWEDAADLEPHVARIREEYRVKRRAILDEHGRSIELVVDALKRRTGFDKLDPDQRHAVLRHVREGADAGTDEHAIAPPLESLPGTLADKRARAEEKAIAALDALLESHGARAVVDVRLDLAGREIETETELDRLLVDVRARVATELAAGHRVRLKG